MDNTVAQIFNKGVAEDKCGNFESAIKLYEEVIKLDPNFEIGYYNLGISLYKARRPIEEAIEKFKQSLKIKTTTRALMNLGNVLFSIERVQEACDIYKKLISFSPNANAHNNYGQCLNVQEKTDEAIKQYQEAIKLNPTHANAYFNYGNSLDFLENKLEAIEKYQKSLFYVKGASMSLSTEVFYQFKEINPFLYFLFDNKKLYLANPRTFNDLLC